MDEQIIPAREVRKIHTESSGSFAASEFGPIGVIDGGAVMFRRADTAPPGVARCGRAEPGCACSGIDTRVELVQAYTGMSDRFIRTALADEARGLAIVGFGRGNVPPAIMPAIGDAVQRRRHRHDLLAIALGPRAARATATTAAARSSPRSARSSPAIFPARKRGCCRWSRWDTARRRRRSRTRSQRVRHVTSPTYTEKQLYHARQEPPCPTCLRWISLHCSSRASRRSRSRFARVRTTSPSIGTVRVRPTTHSSGTATMSGERSAIITPNSPRCSSSTAKPPNRVASIAVEGSSAPRRAAGGRARRAAAPCPSAASSPLATSSAMPPSRSTAMRRALAATSERVPPIGVRAFGDDDDAESRAPVVALADARRATARDVERNLRDQDRVGAAGHAGVERNPAGVPAHHFDDHDRGDALRRSCAADRSRRSRTPPRCRSRSSSSCRRCRCRWSSGTPTSGMPRSQNSCAIASVPSPPMTMSASSPICGTSRRRDRSSRAVPSDVVDRMTSNGLPRLMVPRIVPPRRRMPVTSRGVSTRERSVSIRPSKLSSRPTHSMPAFDGRLDDGADDGVEAGRVAAAGEDADALDVMGMLSTIANEVT